MYEVVSFLLLPLVYNLQKHPSPVISGSEITRYNIQQSDVESSHK